jgi:hypothetical protein
MLISPLRGTRARPDTFLFCCVVVFCYTVRTKPVSGCPYNRLQAVGYQVHHDPYDCMLCLGGPTVEIWTQSPFHWKISRVPPENGRNSCPGPVPSHVLRFYAVVSQVSHTACLNTYRLFLSWPAFHLWVKCVSLHTMSTLVSGVRLVQVLPYSLLQSVGLLMDDSDSCSVVFRRFHIPEHTV